MPEYMRWRHADNREHIIGRQLVDSWDHATWWANL